MAWPRIIALCVGAVGFAAALLGSTNGLLLSFLRGGGHDLRQYLALTVTLAGLSALCLSYALYRGRDWARRVVLWVALIVTACAVAYCGFHTYQDLSLGDSPLAWTNSLGLSLIIITPFVFLICVLLQRDVVRAFSGRSSTHESPKA